MQLDFHTVGAKFQPPPNRSQAAMNLPAENTSEHNNNNHHFMQNLHLQDACNRKRPLQESENTDVANNASFKRSHFNSNMSQDTDGMFHFKLLVPNMAAGAIIGKGGETIAQLQREKNAKIKMSKANDFYPGTTERVCIISSNNPDSIMSVLCFIMDKIREKPELTKQANNSTSVGAGASASAGATTPEMNGPTVIDREKQVKILVPNSTAGMIIGKGGCYIKYIKEQTGAYIQLSQKPKDIALTERCITVSGDTLEANIKVCQLILQKIVDDPQSGAYLNLSYADVAGPVPNFNPTGSPYATKCSLSRAMGGGNLVPPAAGIGIINAVALASAAGLESSLNLTLNMPSAGNCMDTNLTAKLVEHVNLILRAAGFSDQSMAEIAAALSILARYGMLGVGYGLNNGSNNSSGGSAAVGGMDIALASASHHVTPNLFGILGASGNSAPVPSSLHNGSTVYDFPAVAAAASTSSPLDIYHPSNHLTINNNCLTIAQNNDVFSSANMATLTGLDIKKVDMEVSDNVVAAMTAPLGQSLADIQYQSGARVQISKKDAYENVKMVSISGTANAILTAQCLLAQKITEVTKVNE